MPSSIVVSGFIIALVWGTLMFQSESVWDQVEPTQYMDLDDGQSPEVSMAVTKPNNSQVIEIPTSIDSSSTEKSLSKISLQGVSPEIDLTASSVANLWVEYSSLSTLHNRLTQPKVSSYAIYQNSNSDFSRAEVSIGYHKSDLSCVGEVVASLASNHYGEPLSPARHSPEAITSAWTDID